jgi:hypothetical protein
VFQLHTNKIRELTLLRCEFLRCKFVRNLSLCELQLSAKSCQNAETVWETATGAVPFACIGSLRVRLKLTLFSTMVVQ